MYQLKKVIHYLKVVNYSISNSNRRKTETSFGSYKENGNEVYEIVSNYL